MRGLGKIAVMAAVFVSLAGLAEEKNQKSLDLLVAEARNNNPELKAMRDQAGAAKLKIRESTALDAPQVGVDFYQAPVKSFPNPLDDQMEIDYFIQQSFPYPGKLYAGRNSAKSFSGMAEQEYRAKELEIIMELKMAFYQLYFVQRELEINFENRKLMQGFVEIARRQYEVGMVNQADFLRGQTELALLIKQSIELEQEKAVIEAKLDRLLGRKGETEYGRIEAVESEIPDWSFDRLEPIAKNNNPELKMQEYRVSMNQSELSLARMNFAPELMVQGMYKDMQETDRDFWSLMLGVTLPIAPWSSQKYAGKLKESRYYLSKSESEYAAAENLVRADLRASLARIQANRKLSDLYQDSLIPQAEQTLRSTISAYQTGKTEFLVALDAYRMVLTARVDYEMAIMNYMSGQAELEKAVGLEIEEIKGVIK